MWPFHRQYIHEPLALAATLSAALTINVLWIINLFFNRSWGFNFCAKVASGIEIMAIIYGLSIIIFFVLFGVLAIIFRGRDCSHYRNDAFGFLLISFLIYLLMTVPPIYEFNL